MSDIIIYSDGIALGQDRFVNSNRRGAYSLIVTQQGKDNIEITNPVYTLDDYCHYVYWSDADSCDDGQEIERVKITGISCELSGINYILNTLLSDNISNRIIIVPSQKYISDVFNKRITKWISNAEWLHDRHKDFEQGPFGIWRNSRGNYIKYQKLFESIYLIDKKYNFIYFIYESIHEYQEKLFINCKSVM